MIKVRQFVEGRTMKSEFDSESHILPIFILSVMKSLGAKSGQYGGCSRHSQLNSCNKTAVCLAVWGLGTK